MKVIIGLFILIGIVFTVSVFAAGSSEGGNTGGTSEGGNTGGTSGGGGTTNNIIINNISNETLNRTRDDDRDENKTEDDNETRRNRGRGKYLGKECDDFEKRKDRIKCRIIQGENYTAPTESLPEACKLENETLKGTCMAFYRKIQACYLDKHGKIRDSCFRKASGLVKKFSEEEQEGRKEKARNYMVTLLYELEERVEKTHEKGRISDDDAVLLVDKIVEIKKAILEGKNKEEIKIMLKDLKKTWKASKIKIDEANKEENEAGEENNRGENDE